MKKMILAFALAVSGFAHADGYVYIPPTQFMQGDFFTAPVTGATNNSIYFAKFLSNTTGAMAAATGVSVGVKVMFPFDARNGEDAVFGATVSYAGITNSANLAADYQLHETTLYNSSAVTNSAVVTGSNVQIPTAATNAFYDVELATIAGAKPGSIASVYVYRSLGSNTVLHIHRFWVRYKRTGWLN